MALISCPECSQKVSDKAPTCPHCGVPFKANAPEPPRPTFATGLKHGLPAVLSLVIPGVGQLLKGDLKKGALLLGLTLMVAAVMALLGPLGPVQFVLWFGVAAWVVFDAYNHNVERLDEETTAAMRVVKAAGVLVANVLLFLLLNVIVWFLLWMVVMIVPGLAVPSAFPLLPFSLPTSGLAFWSIRRWYFGSAKASSSPDAPASAG